MQKPLTYRTNCSFDQRQPDSQLLWLIVFALIGGYTRGLWGLLSIGPFGVKLLSEGPVLMLAGYMFNRKGFRFAPGGRWIALLTIWILISAVIVGETPWDAFLFVRWPLYGYTLYCAGWNAKIDKTRLRRLVIAVLGLWILQIVFAVGKVFLFQARTEAIVGTLSSGGGVAGTLFPLLVLAYALAFHFRYRASAWFIALGFGSAFVGFSNSKRAIYYYIPVLVATICIREIWLQRHRITFREIMIPVTAIAVLIPFYIYGLANSGGISAYGVRPGRTQSVSWDEISPTEQFEHAIDVVFEHESTEKTDSQGRYGSRTGVTLHVLRSLTEAPLKRVFCGNGYRSYITDESRGVYNYYYGATGLVTDIVVAGIPAMVFNLLFFVTAMRVSGKTPKLPKGAFYHALQTGTGYAFLVFFIIYFTYANSIALAGWFTYTLLLAAGLLRWCPSFMQVSVKS